MNNVNGILKNENKKVTNSEKLNTEIPKLLPYFLLVAAITLRLVPHMPNFAPVTAIALFAGTYLPKRWAVVLPLTAMAITDIWLGYYQAPIMIAVYASFAISALIGLKLRKQTSFNRILGSSLLASISFYLITNAAVWAFSGGYDLTIAGLVRCFLLALPFFRNTLLGDLFYVTVMFGSLELVYWIIRKERYGRRRNYGRAI